MEGIEELLRQQDEAGDKLERLLINFKKDSADRKTSKYIADRLELAEEYWTIIQANNKQLAPLEEKYSDLPYFKNQYFTKIEMVYYKLTALLLKQKGTEQEKQPLASTSKTQPQDDQQSKGFTRSGECEEDNFNDTTADDQQLQKGEEVHRIVRRQKALMRLTTHQIQDIESKVEESHPKPYYEIKIKILKKHQEEMIKNDQQIWELSTEDKPLGYEPDLLYNLDGWVQDTMVLLQQKLEDIDKNASVEQSHHVNTDRSSIKLPKITLPTFDGNYLRWTQFHDLYTQLIHEQSMPNTQKMFYLTTNLSGEARALIQHLPVSSENYEDAWNILNNRYNNKRLLVTALLNKLLSQPTTQPESATSIKILHDTTNECLLGLKNLGLPVDSWDPLIVHLIIKKFDKNTLVLYEQSLEAPRELNSIQNVLKFLETRFQSLEALGGRASGILRHTPKVTAHQKSSFMATSSRGSCIACKKSHPLYFCKQFLTLSPSSRLRLLQRHNLCVNCMKESHSPKNCPLQGCKKCTAKHNTLVHLEGATKASTLDQTNKKIPSKAHEGNQHSSTNQQLIGPQSTTLAAQAVKPTRSYVLLSTAVVKLRNNEGLEIECRAVLDSGSQLNFITDHIAKKLSLRETHDPLNIQGIGQGPQRTQKRVNVELHSKTTTFSTRIEAHILSQITTYQPSQFLDITNWPIPDNIELADSKFYSPGKIDLLIGAENFLQLLTAGQIKLGQDLPTIQNTVFGWIIGGKTSNTRSEQVTCGICSEEEAKLNEQVEKFWKQEEPDASKPAFSAAEIKCETHFCQNVKRNEEGRFIVRLPFLQDPSALGESKDIALNRFYALERKLAKNSEVKKQYVDFIKEYQRLGHMEEISFEKISFPYYFLPHHCVMKPDSTSTKLRVVFDASMKTSTNASLNDLLYTGPTIQDELFSILLRFRLPRFVFTADIEKMYRQVLLHNDDRKYQLILWRNDPTEKLRCYQLSTVTYGVRTAPYLATKCLQRLSNQTADQYPLGAAALLQDFYVDDLMTGCNSLREAMETQEQLNKILESGGFKLRKWCANHSALLKNIPAEDIAPQLELHEDGDCHIKTLGITWLPRSDEFSISTQWANETVVTKRKVLSDIAHLFDPLGFMTPVIVKAKLFLQELWSLKFGWDDNLPEAYCSKWNNFLQNLTALSSIRIPRHVFSSNVPSYMYFRCIIMIKRSNICTSRLTKPTEH